MALPALDEALRKALSLVRPATSIVVPIDEAEGFLAEPITASRDVPGCDNSAMDGFALRAGETAGATRETPAKFRLIETIYAGRRPGRAIGPGEAARIFTGAALPEGADVVVRQEAARLRAEEVEIFVEAPLGQHIRRRGEEIARGTEVFGVGQRIDAYVAGVLATLGRAELRVFEKPRVAIVTVGDELVPLGGEAAPHQVFSSNAVVLRRLCAEAGGEVVATVHGPDDEDALRGVLERALVECEVLITSGGASVGDRDRVKASLLALGAQLEVDGVALKPGKPVGVARFSASGKVAVVLPGNPGAAVVAFDRIARPVLLAMQGVVEVRRRSRVRLDAGRTKQAGLTYFLSAKLDANGSVHVRPQGAGQLLQNVELDGWVELPAGQAEFKAGEWVDFEHVAGARFYPLPGQGEGKGAHRSGPIAVSVIGESGSGKTTLIEAVIAKLQERGVRVAVMKHTPDHYPVHKAGSDTEKFAAAGAAGVAFWTGGVTQITSATDPIAALEQLRRVSGADLVLVEGWKDGPLPKIEMGSALARPGTILTVASPADVDLVLEVLVRWV